MTRRPWADWRWVAAIAGLLAAVSLATIAVTSVITGGQVQDQQPVLDKLQSIADTNSDNIAAIERSQASIDRSLANTDEIVAFVRELRADAAAGDDGTADAVALIVGLICSIGDPGVQAACAALQPEATP